MKTEGSRSLKSEFRGKSSYSSSSEGHLTVPPISRKDEYVYTKESKAQTEIMVKLYTNKHKRETK